MVGAKMSINCRAQLAGQNRLELPFFIFNTNQLHEINVFKIRKVIRGRSLYTTKV